MNTSHMSKSLKPVKTMVMLMLIMLLAAWMRIQTFWLPHAGDDEVINIGLALKLDSCGMEGYNLYRINPEPFSLGGSSTIVELLLDDENNEGWLLEGIQKRGLNIYHQPLHYAPPAFPFLIMLSQKTIGKGNGYFYSMTKSSLQIDKTAREGIFISQAYAAIIPFAMSLLLVLLLFFVALKLFNTTTALIAAFLMAVNPVSIFVSQKIWADETSLAVTTLGFLIVLFGFEKRSLIAGIAAGFTLGLAVLLKQTAGFFIIALLIFYIFDQKEKLKNINGLLDFTLNPFMLAFSLVFAGLVSYWFLLVYKNFGTPFYLPVVEDVIKDTFYMIRQSRPPAFVLFTVGVTYLSPFFILAPFSFFSPFKNDLPIRKRKFLNLLLIWILMTFFFAAIVFQSKEHKHFIMAYPALILAASHMIAIFHKWLKAKTVNWRWLGADELLIIILLLNARWTALLVLEAISRGDALLLKPF